MTSPIHTYSFDVEGLTCASCVTRAETAIASVKGVTDHSVNLANHRGRFSGTKAQADGVFAALKAAGYPAKLYEQRFSVEGMSCASCIAKVETALEAAPSVVSAQANLADGSVTVRSLSRDDATVVPALAQLGYSAAPYDAAPPETRSEVQAQYRRFLISLVLTLPVFVMEMGAHAFPAVHHYIARTIGTPTSWTIQFVLATLVLVWPGQEFYRKGIPSLVRRRPDMNALVVLGATAAWGYSVVALFAPQVLPAADRAVYFEAAAVIVTLILLGRWLEARAKGQTGDAIRRLIGLRPDTATVLRDGHEITVPIDDIVTGDHLRIRPGERIPVDGSLLEGRSWVDESMITGEPVAVEKTHNSPLTGGTINGSGALVMVADAVGADTTLARIIAMVESAQATRLPVQNLVNRITAWFVPAVMLVAALTVCGWLLFGPDPVLSNALIAGVSVLIIACPCAMGLAVPVSIMVGAGRAAELGVLFRQGDALQTLGQVGTIAFDKTGTLTVGEPKLTDLQAVDGDSDELLAVTAAIEAQSEHPLAKPIIDAAQGLPIGRATDVEAITGRGLRGTVDGETVLVGNDRLLAEQGIDIGPLAKTAARLAAQARTVVYVAKAGQLLGVLGLADASHARAKETISGLANRGIATALITGDTEPTALAIADELGIATVHAQTLPADKAKVVQKLQSAGAVGFVGDGINDAPALARADVGIAMGGGTDVAMESADVVLMRSDPSAVLTALRVSVATMRNIRQNLYWAFGYNVLLIPVAALGLLTPALAAGAMALSSVLVVTNALRLKRVRA